jgi:acyl-CoA thioesterase FadM
VRTFVGKVGGASIEHSYEVIRDTMIIASGRTVVVCVDREGRVRRLPEWLLA